MSRSKELGMRQVLTAPNLEFLGIGVLEVSAKFIKYTTNDRRCAFSMLKHSWIYNPEFSAWKQQIQLGLFLGYKGEINVVNRQEGDLLAGYICRKLVDTPKEFIDF
jgi:DNA topoisomerase VI subunit A